MFGHGELIGMGSDESTETVSHDTERGDMVRFGPFEFRIPDRDCQITDCGQNADGVVDFDGEDRTISCCISCAPQFLDVDGSEWTPLAGGRSLPTGVEADG